MTNGYRKEIVYFPYMQIILMGATALTFCLFLIKPLREFTSLNKGPSISRLPAAVHEKLMNEHRLVHTDLTIYDAPALGSDSHHINFQGTVIFTYDPRVISLDLIKKFDIQNGTLKKQEPIVINHANGLQTAHFGIKADFAMHIDYRDYPLDDHRIAFALINIHAKPHELAYIVNPQHFEIEASSAMSRWQDVGHEIESGLIEQPYELGRISYPAVGFGILYNHVGIRKTTIIILPLFLLFFLMTFALSLDPRNYHTTIITIAVTGISSLIAYRYVIEAISPKVGYFMMSDYLFFLFFITAFITFLLSIIIEQIPVYALRWIILALYCWVIAFCAYFILIWL